MEVHTLHPWEMSEEEWRKTPLLYGRGKYWQEFHRAIMAKATFTEA